eukprot:1177212-Prorocentrum_minimum.AAC.2
MSKKKKFWDGSAPPPTATPCRRDCRRASRALAPSSRRALASPPVKVRVVGVVSVVSKCS